MLFTPFNVVTLLYDSKDTFVVKVTFIIEDKYADLHFLSFWPVYYHKSQKCQKVSQ